MKTSCSAAGATKETDFFKALNCVEACTEKALAGTRTLRMQACVYVGIIAARNVFGGEKATNFCLAVLLARQSTREGTKAVGQSAG